MNRYLLLSLCTGIFESGALVLAVSLAESVAWLGLIYGFAWQIGNALATHVRAFPAAQRLLEACCICVAYQLEDPFILAPTFASLAHHLQYVRSQFQDGSGTLIKRTYRVVGFVIGGLFYVHSAALLVWMLCSILLAILARSLPTERPKARGKGQWTFMSTIMVLHQIHYFLYAYGIVWILQEKDNIPLAAMGAAFAIGWIIYLAVEPILGKVNYFIALVLGHVFVAGVLLLMSSEAANGISTILWVLTGLGGGTVYCIHRMAGTDAEMDRAEEIGHWVGPALAIIVFSLGFGWDAVLQVAAVFAILVATLALMSRGGSQPT